jgi:hypothetical protein
MNIIYSKCYNGVIMVPGFVDAVLTHRPPRGPTPLATSVYERIFFHFCLTTALKQNCGLERNLNETSERIGREEEEGEEEEAGRRRSISRPGCT